MIPLYVEVQSTDGGQTWTVTGEVTTELRAMQEKVLKRALDRFTLNDPTCPFFGYVQYQPAGNNPVTAAATFVPTREEGGGQ